MKDDNKLLVDAVRASDRDKCRLLLQKHADPNAVWQGEDGLWRVLHIATMNEDVELCRMLTEYGADIGLPSLAFETGKTALAMAAENGNTELCRLFLQQAKSGDNPVYALLLRKEEYGYEGKREEADSLQHIGDYRPGEHLPCYREGVLRLLVRNALSHEGRSGFTDLLMRNWAYSLSPLFGREEVPVIAEETGLPEALLGTCYELLTRKQVSTGVKPQKAEHSEFLHMEDLGNIKRVVPKEMLINLMHLLARKRDTAFGHTDHFGEDKTYHIDTFVYFSGTRHTAREYLKQKGEPGYRKEYYEI